GGTVFYTSHILSEVERVADKVAIMHQGRILEIGYLDDIKESFCAVTIERSASKSSTVPEIDGYLYKSTEGEDIYIVKKAYAEERHLDFQPVPFEVLFEALVLGQKSQEQDKTV
nr:ABC transporter ATP-binding protein [Fervidobacterium sp.]